VLEVLRLQTLYLINVHLGKKGIKSVKKLWTYEWESKDNKVTDNKPFTKEDAERLQKLFPVGKNTSKK
jgi:hypothetical protein